MRSAPFRVGIGGIAIESSTFSPHPSTLQDFTVRRGPEMQPRYPFLPGWRFRERDDVTWLPCRTPGHPRWPRQRGRVRALKGELLDRVRAALPLDGFFFDVHGAMAVQGLEDAEADLAGAIRRLVGPRCLFTTGQDLHGNVSARLVELVDLFTAHRLAPHDDAPLTTERACTLLLACLTAAPGPCEPGRASRPSSPASAPAPWSSRGKTVYARLAESDGVAGVLDASLWVGYAWADGRAAGRASSSPAPAPPRSRPRPGRSPAASGTPATPSTSWPPLAPPTGASSAPRARCAGAGHLHQRLGGQSHRRRRRRRPLLPGPPPGAPPLRRRRGQRHLRQHPRPGRGRSVPPRRPRPGRPPLPGRRARPAARRPLACAAPSPRSCAMIRWAGTSPPSAQGGVHAVVTSAASRTTMCATCWPSASTPPGTTSPRSRSATRPDLRAAARHACWPSPRGGRPGHPGLTYRRVPRPVFPLDPAMAWEPDVRLFGDQYRRRRTAARRKSVAAKRCLMIGGGGMAGNWLRRFFPPFAGRLEVVGLVDVSEAVLAEAGDFLGLPAPRRFTRIAPAFETVDADFCAIVVPPAHHEEAVLGAVGRGLPILSEKPVADTWEASLRIRRCRAPGGAEDAGGPELPLHRAQPDPTGGAAGGRPGRLNYLVGRFAADYRLYGSWGKAFRHEIPHGLLVEGSVHHFDMLRNLAGADSPASPGGVEPGLEHVQGRLQRLYLMEMTNGVRPATRGRGRRRRAELLARRALPGGVRGGRHRGRARPQVRIHRFAPGRGW